MVTGPEAAGDSCGDAWEWVRAGWNSISSADNERPVCFTEHELRMAIEGL